MSPRHACVYKAHKIKVKLEFHFAELEEGRIRKQSAIC